MTGRGVATAFGSALLAYLGWALGWPELTGLGTAGIALVLVVVALHAIPPRAELGCDRSSVRTARDNAITISVEVRQARVRRSMRVVVGDLADPQATLRVPRARDGSTVRVPVDTSRRGQFELGPYRLVHGDPWGLKRRVVDEVRGGTVLVHPRVRQLRRGTFIAALLAESDSISRRHGQDHFFALRDYVLGDEPRTVHWRSSARAGKLVVRQQVAAASSGTAVVLDTDVTAYGSDTAFSSRWDPERFEAAVEVAASLAVAQTTSAEKVHFVTTTRGSRLTTAESGAAGAVLDVLAVAVAVPSMDAAPEEVLRLLRGVRCSRVVVVTGTPSQAAIGLASAASRLASTTIVRVQGAGGAMLQGLRTIDVDSADDLG